MATTMYTSADGYIVQSMGVVMNYGSKESMLGFNTTEIINSPHTSKTDLFVC